VIYKAGSLQHGQGAVFLMATKLRTRTAPFIDIPLIDTQAAGPLGEAGASGWIDTHFWERFSGAMMVGMIPDVAQWASGAAKNNKDNQTDYTANSRQAFADIAREAFSNSVNIPPTLYKNQGEIITLIVGQDLDFSGIYKLKMR
jgi:type IV secretion system protein VirB10